MNNFTIRDGKKVSTFVECPTSEKVKLNPLFDFIINNYDRKIYNKDILESNFYDVMYNLIVRYNKRAYYDRLMKKQKKKYFKAPSDYLFVYLRKIAYSKTRKVNEPFYRQIIRKHNFSLSRIKKLIEILTRFHIVEFKKGFYSPIQNTGFCSRISLLPYKRWTVLPDTIEEFLLIIGSCLNVSTNQKYLSLTKYSKRIHSAYCKDVTKDQFGNPAPDLDPKRIDNYYVMPGSIGKKREVELINSVFPDYLSFLGYQRAFGKTESSYGRLFSIIHRIPRELRDKAIEKYELVYLDFSSFNIKCTFRLK